ncbi:MAG: cyclase family protein [Gilvibacter sp.]
MRATILHNQEQLTVNLSEPLDISLPLTGEANNPTAWYLSAPEITPVKGDSFIGEVAQGGSVNFKTIVFNPHAHGTHTEGIGHITAQFNSVQEAITSYFFKAKLITIQPKISKGDMIITQDHIREALQGQKPEAVIIRTRPNHKEKQHKQWSHTNWPYLSQQAAQYLCELGVQHLLIDTPSVDKEKDDGALLAHKAFWNFESDPRMNATITEFVFVANAIEDGDYLLNLQLANMVNDAAPSRPVLYKLLVTAQESE